MKNNNIFFSDQFVNFQIPFPYQVNVNVLLEAEISVILFKSDSS